MRPPAAARADEAVRPAQLEDERAAQLLGSIEFPEFGLRQAFLELHRVAGHEPSPADAEENR